MKDLNLDFSREERQGFPEVVYGEGKDLDQLQQICLSYRDRGQALLITRLKAEFCKELCGLFPEEELQWNATGACLAWRAKEQKVEILRGRVTLISAGSSDRRVLSEAEATLTFFGAVTDRIADSGVAGVHRILARRQELDRGTVHIVVAGMDGALPSVVGGLSAAPVIAVPSSVGYGAAFGGVAALLAMLNSCASGVTVVNIDNGFGAAMAALKILRAVSRL